MEKGDIASDFSSFSQMPPEQAAAVAERARKAKAEAKKAREVLAPKQLEIAQKVTEDMKAEQEKDQKAAILRKINAYAKAFPDRVSDMKVTAAKGAKASLEELEIILRDIEHELGKTSSLDMLCIGYSEAMAGIETLSKKWNPLGLQLDNLGAVTQANMSKIRPLLEEFAIKHENWFSQKVEMRIVVMTAQIVMTVDRMNKQGAGEQMMKAKETKPSESVRQAAQNL